MDSALKLEEIAGSDALARTALTVQQENDWKYNKITDLEKQIEEMQLEMDNLES